MLDRLLSSSFYVPPGGFPQGFPFSIMTSLHFLLMLRLLLVSQPIMADSHQAVVLCMRYKSGRITASFISLPTFKEETSAGYLAASY